MNHSSETACSLEFFKVFLPDSGSLHMSIPPAFLKHLHGTFPEKATIRDQTGKSWRVTLERVDELVYFKNGWQAFVDYHFLKYGDFLVFQYDGRFTFDVKIFGKNGCKKAVVAEAARSVLPVEVMVAEANNSVPILDAVVAVAGKSLPILKVKVEAEVEKEEEVKPLISGKRKRLQVGSVIVHKPRRVSTRGRPGNASNSVEYVAPKGPFFERTMKRWSNKKIYVSGRVVRDQNISLKPNIVLRDEEGKLWPATVRSISQNRLVVNTGWSEFYKGNGLRVNDKCEFEFVFERGNLCRQLNVKVTHRRPALR